jgi:hypothetical protein
VGMWEKVGRHARRGIRKKRAADKINGAER